MIPWRLRRRFLDEPPGSQPVLHALVVERFYLVQLFVTPDTFEADSEVGRDLNPVTQDIVGLLGDNDLAAARGGLDSRGDVHVRAHDPIFGSGVGSYVSHHHFTRMNADSHSEFREPLEFIL